MDSGGYGWPLAADEPPRVPEHPIMLSTLLRMSSPSQVSSSSFTVGSAMLMGLATLRHNSASKITPIRSLFGLGEDGCTLRRLTVP